MKAELHKMTGIVIAQNPYGEADLHIRLLSNQHGKVSVIAKHARKSLRRFQGRLELLDLIQCDYKNWKEDLTVLEGSILLSSFPELRENYDKLIVALCSCEICDLITRPNQPEDSHYLFPRLSNFLKQLAEADCLTEQYQKKLLRDLFTFTKDCLVYSGLETNSDTPASFNALFELFKKLEEFCERRLNSSSEIYKMSVGLKKFAK